MTTEELLEIRAIMQEVANMEQGVAHYIETRCVAQVAVRALSNLIEARELLAEAGTFVGYMRDHWQGHADNCPAEDDLIDGTPCDADECYNGMSRNLHDKIAAYLGDR